MYNIIIIIMYTAATAIGILLPRTNAVQDIIRIPHYVRMTLVVLLLLLYMLYGYIGLALRQSGAAAAAAVILRPSPVDA